MSFFSHLFHHPPKPSPYPIQGRDEEFRTVITILYREELGRDPDPGGLASWMHAAQYGWTGEQIRQALHDSPEGVAYRAIPPTPTLDHPLVGQLAARNGVFYDATGPRIVQFYSDFPLLRIWNDNKPEALRAMDAAVKARRHGVRFGIPLVETEDQNDGYWRGAHVPPDMAQAHLRDVLDALAERKLKAHLFGAYNFGSWERERAFIQWQIDTIVGAGHQPTIGLWEWRNEYFMTSPYGGNSDETYRHGAEACQMVRDGLGCLVTMGSPGEDDDEIARSTPNASVVSIDFGRDYPGSLLMKHAHRAYYDGRYHGKYKGRALWVTEPTGPNAGPNGPGDVYVPLDDPAFLYGLHAIYALTGQAVSYFNGPAVRHRYPIDTGWGFYELPRLLDGAFIPEDIGEWVGPTWFVKPGTKQFVTVVAEEWGVLERPDRPIARWTAQFFDSRLVEGEGPIRLPAGYKAVAVRGEWV